MPNFQEELRTYFAAGYAALHVNSHEEERAIEEILSAARLVDRQVWLWKLGEGWSVMTDDKKKKQVDAKTPTLALQKAIDEGPEGSVFVLPDFDPFLKVPENVRKIKSSLPKFSGKKKTFIFLGPVSGIPPHLEKLVTVLDMTLPSREELGAILDDIASGLKEKIATPTRSDMIEAAAGLTIREAEDAFSRARITAEKFDRRAIQVVQREKAATIKKGGVLEVWDRVESPENLGGLAALKKYFSRARLAFTPEAKDFGLLRMSGALLAGLPGCLEGQVRVHLADGRAVKIQDLAREVSDTLIPGVYPYCRELLMPDGSFALAQALHIYETQVVRRICLKDGRSISVTRNHPLMTPDGWHPASDLVVGDKLKVVNTTPSKHEQPRRFRALYHRVPKANRCQHKLSFPEEMTPELAMFMGLLTAEGHRDSGYRHHRISLTFGTHEETVIKWAVEFSQHLGLESPSLHCVGDNAVAVRMNSIEAYSTFARFLVKQKTRRVPEPIFHCPSSVVAPYLRGLFEGDGCVVEGRSDYCRAVSLKTASKGLAEDVQLLLLRFGIPSRIYEGAARHPDHPDQLLPSFSLRVSGRRYLEVFQKEIGFMSEEKQRKIVSALESYKREGADERSEWVAISSIEEGAADRVFDLEVPDYHCYVANGIVSHNTGKSLAAKVAAHIFEWPLIRLDIGRVFGSLVGMSEERARFACAQLEATAPCICWIEEMEKAFAGVKSSGATDSGVSSRVKIPILT